MINGTVVNSVLSPGVRVDVGAVVRDSIIMFDTVIRSGAVVDRAILDKEVVVGQTAIVGDGPDYDTPNRQEPGRLNDGHHGRGQAVGRAARRAPRPQRQGRRAGASRPTSRRASSSPAARSSTGRAGRRRPGRADTASHRRGSSRASPTDGAASGHDRRPD